MKRAGWMMAVALLPVGAAWGAEDRIVSLPDAPSFVGQAAKTGSAVVTGVVLDIKGVAVPGAQVTLSGLDGRAAVVAVSDAAGAFRFAGVGAGEMRITVTSPGLETFVSNEFKLTTGETYELPKIDLPVAPANSSVTVTVTEDQLATEQVKEQEQQRILGVLPNFYSSYLWNAAPMRSKQKYHLAIRSVTDPFVFFGVTLRAGISQARGTDPGYGDGFPGFARRFGASYGDAVTGRLIGSAILPSVFHQDPRYFYRGSGSVKSRIWYAATRAVVCRGDNGKNEPNYSHVLGNFAAAGLRNLYLDPSDRKGVDVLLNGFTVTGLNAVTNVVREFVVKPLSTHVPDYKKGKPEDEK